MNKGLIFATMFIITAGIINLTSCTRTEKKSQEIEKTEILLEEEGKVASRQLKLQTKCPLTGLDINRNIYTDYNGKRIYFCCTGCRTEFLKTPEEYMEKLKEQGVILEDASTQETE